MDPQTVESIIRGLGYGFAIISGWAVAAHWTLWEFPSPLVQQEGNDAPPGECDRGTQTDPARENGSTGRDEQQNSTDPPDGDGAIGEDAELKSMSPQNNKKGKNRDRFGRPSDPTDAETISRLQNQLNTQGETLKEQGEELERCEDLRRTERQRNRDREAKFKEKIAKLQEDMDEANSGSDRTPFRDATGDEIALSETQSKLATANNDLRAKQREHQNVKAELGRKLAEEQTKLSKAATDRDIALGEAQNARTMAQTAREEGATARNELNALEQRKTTVQEDLTATEADLEKKRKSLDSLDKELKRKRREAEQALNLQLDEQKRVRTAAHEEELDEKKRRNFEAPDDVLEKKKREDSKEHEDALKEKQRTDFEALDKEVDDKRRADFAEIDKQFKKKQDFLGTLDDDLEQRRNEMTQLQRDIETAKRRANQELENTNTAKSRVQGEVDSANTTLNATRISISEAQRKLDGLRADAAKQQKAFNDTKLQMEDEYSTARGTLRGLHDRVKATQRQLEEVREQVRLLQQQSDNQSYNYIPPANATPASSAHNPSFGHAGNSLKTNGFHAHANTQQQAPSNGTFFGDIGSNTLPFGVPGQHPAQVTSVQPSSGSEINELQGENFQYLNTEDGMPGVEEGDIMDIDNIDSPIRAAPSYVETTAPQQGPLSDDLPGPASFTGPFDGTSFGQNGASTPAPGTAVRDNHEQQTSSVFEQYQSSASTGDSASSSGNAYDQFQDGANEAHTPAAHNVFGMFGTVDASAPTPARPTTTTTQQDDEVDVGSPGGIAEQFDRLKAEDDELNKSSSEDQEANGEDPNDDFLPTDKTVREYYKGRGQESVTLNELCEEWEIDEVDREKLRLQVQRLGLLAVDSVEVKSKSDDQDHPDESSDDDDAAGSGSDEDKIPSYKDTRDSSSRRDKTDNLSNRSESPEPIKIGGNSVAETYIHSPFNRPNPRAEYQTRNANYASTPSSPAGGPSFVALSTSPYTSQQPRTSFHHAATGVTYHPTMPKPSPNYGQQSSPSHILRGGRSTSSTWKPKIPSTSPYYGQQQSPAYTRFDGGSTGGTSAPKVPSTSPYYGQQPPAAFLRAKQPAYHGKSKAEASGV